MLTLQVGYHVHPVLTSRLAVSHTSVMPASSFMWVLDVQTLAVTLAHTLLPSKPLPSPFTLLCLFEVSSHYVALAGLELAM